MDQKFLILPLKFSKEYHVENGESTGKYSYIARDENHRILYEITLLENGLFKTTMSTLEWYSDTLERAFEQAQNDWEQLIIRHLKPIA